MESNRYTNTLTEVPATIIEIKKASVSYGKEIIKDAFQLANDQVVIESKKDKHGYYAGGTMESNGHFQPTEDRYEPVYDEDGNLCAFRQIEQSVNSFAPEELGLIARYALNTKANLITDLHEFYKSTTDDALRETAKYTLVKLNFMPDAQCRQLMADIYWAFRERSLHSTE